MELFNQISLFNQNSLNNIDINSKEELLKFIKDLIKIEDIQVVKNSLIKLKKLNKNKKIVNDYSCLEQDIEQMIESLTLERVRYYLNRLIKSLTQTKTSNVNDLDLNKWKQYDDIITDSLWILEKRDTTGAHNAEYWGNFIPQIPNQLFRRFTKQGEWVIDTFLGSGTSLIECRRLGRNGIGIELQGKVVEIAKSNINNEINPFNIKTEIIQGDCLEVDYNEILKNNNLKHVQFIIMHPPYWDIIKFSEYENDFSNSKNLQDFLDKINLLVSKTYPILQKGRHLAFVIGDKYSNGEWIPLGFYCMNEIMKAGYKLKSIIVKNFEETRGKKNQKELWRYRALLGGFYVFKHEYILLFKKD